MVKEENASTTCLYREIISQVFNFLLWHYTHMQLFHHHQSLLSACILKPYQSKLLIYSFLSAHA